MIYLIPLISFLYQNKNMPKNNKLHILRRISQILFILLIVAAPVFDILRFDSDTRSLIILGSEWDLGLSETFYIDPSFGNASHIAWRFFLKAILPWIGILALFPLLGVITGRFFCGWFCPEGTLFELFDLLTLKIFGRRSIFGKNPNDPPGPSNNRIPYILIALLSMFVIPLFFGVALTGYFVNPGTIWSQIINWEFTLGVKAGIIGVSIYILISSVIVRHTLCKYVCSAGLMQMLFGCANPVSLRIKLDTARLGSCTDCKSCETVCFMNVKPRLPKRDINCVNCGECIQACNNELGKGNGLFSFSHTKLPVPPEEKADTKAVDFALNYKQHTLGETCEKTCR